MGASGSGKSTFARAHFAPTAVLSSDACRALVRDDETAQEATADAFEVLHFIARKRLAARRLTVVDATNVRPEDRRQLVAIAREYHAMPVALAFDIPERICQERNLLRADRPIGRRVIRTSASCCATRCAGCAARDSANTAFSRRRRSTPPSSNASRCRRIAARTAGRSTSSAICTAASTS